MLVNIVFMTSSLTEYQSYNSFKICEVSHAFLFSGNIKALTPLLMPEADL